jgi:ZIP family zinc transporter
MRLVITLEGLDKMGHILFYSALAGLATGLGALIIVLVGRPPARVLSGMLGFAGGIMLAISALELLPEALELGTLGSTVVGFALGAGLMTLLDVYLPHIHMGLTRPERDFENGYVPAPDVELLKLGVFIAIGIGLHNLPEGLAIGAGYFSSPAMGIAIVIGLALHNIPEGMVTAGPLLLGGMSKLKIILLTSLVGLMTPIGTLIGALLFNTSEVLVSGALALAAGAMVYIVSDELIPQSHRYHSHTANAGLLIGFVLVLLLG